MRDDVVITEVLSKCEVLKRANIWPAEPRMRPRLWLKNFEEKDRADAAILLDKFSFYSARQSDALLVASFRSLGDGRPKNAVGQSRDALIAALARAVVTPVLGEDPDPTDSGNLLCRRARQLMFHAQRSVTIEDALRQADAGVPVVFVDDFVGSGDQFLATWRRELNGLSFEAAQRKSGFVAIYVALMGTDYGLKKISENAPSVAVSVTHVIEARSTLEGIAPPGTTVGAKIEALLDKYSPRLTPREEYIAKNELYRKYGYKERKLLLAFDHSVPDATLPIFWSPGHSGWEPLIERT